MTLYKLAELGANKRYVQCKTGDLAGKMGISQQTASRRLIEMEEAGLIERTREGRNQGMKVTAKGVSELSEMYNVLRKVVDLPSGDLILRGTLFTGLAEGSYYVSQEGYRRQFKSRLGFDPFPGTLNVRLKREDLDSRRRLESYPYVYIEGFQNKKRSYGPAKCYKAIVDEKVAAAIILPVRAHYGEDVIELISAEQLRRKLHLRDGDMVQVRTLLHPD